MTGVEGRKDIKLPRATEMMINKTGIARSGGKVTFRSNRVYFFKLPPECSVLDYSQPLQLITITEQPPITVLFFKDFYI